MQCMLLLYFLRYCPRSRGQQQFPIPLVTVARSMDDILLYYCLCLTFSLLTVLVLCFVYFSHWSYGVHCHSFAYCWLWWYFSSISVTDAASVILGIVNVHPAWNARWCFLFCLHGTYYIVCHQFAIHSRHPSLLQFFTLSFEFYNVCSANSFHHRLLSLTALLHGLELKNKKMAQEILCHHQVLFIAYSLLTFSYDYMW